MITLPFISAWFVMVMLGIVGHEFDKPELFVSYWACFAAIALLILFLKVIAFIAKGGRYE